MRDPHFFAFVKSWEKKKHVTGNTEIIRSGRTITAAERVRARGVYGPNGRLRADKQFLVTGFYSRGHPTVVGNSHRQRGDIPSVTTEARSPLTRSTTP